MNQLKISKQSSDYPFLFVNIGSGVSILKIDANNKFERITGTSVGGGTLYYIY